MTFVRKADAAAPVADHQNNALHSERVSASAGTRFLCREFRNDPDGFRVGFLLKQLRRKIRIYVTAMLLAGVITQTATLTQAADTQATIDTQTTATTQAAADNRIADLSPFPIHGVVEGFYGSHWTPDERLDIIRFMGEFGLQSYFYAPKDDPYHRSRWREPYAGEQLAIFEELLEVARRHNVTIYYAISPGLDMVYSSEEDYQALLAKMEAMIGLGITHVALFLDDVPETLNHAADKEAFANLGEAHVHVINRLYRDLHERGTELAVCPTTYTDAWGDRDYVRILGEGVPIEIPLFWTGVDVAIARITAGQARNWGEKMQRKPLIWDNFPVNDYDSWRVFLGPLEGRDPELASTTTGIVANPMNQPYASMIPLATVAYYALDPYNYEPEPALERALQELFPAETLPHIRKLVTLYREPGWEDNIFTPIYTPGKPFHVETIARGLQRFEDALAGLAELGYDGKANGDDNPGPDTTNPDSDASSYSGTAPGPDAYPDDDASIQPPAKERRVHGLVAELEPFLEKTRADFQALVDNPAYYTDARGLLHYNVERQTLQARRTPFEVTLDGDLTEWHYEAFHAIPVAGRTLTPDPASATNGSGFRHPEVAVVHDDTHLYFGLRFYREGDLMTRDPFFQGDHIMLLVDTDPADTDTWIRPQDPIVVMRPQADPTDAGTAADGTDPDRDTAGTADDDGPPDVTAETSDVAAGASAARAADGTIAWQEPGFKTRILDLTPFTQRGISDIHLYTLTGFFYHQMANPVHDETHAFGEQVRFGWMPTGYGYSAVVAIPHGGEAELRATLAGLMTTETEDGRRSYRFLLSKRPYLGNTYTFPLIQLTGLD